VDNEPVTAVEQAAEVEEGPGNVDVRDVDVPVFVRPKGLLEAFPFERKLAPRGRSAPHGRERESFG
jgi:hypothetical protein